MLCISFFFSISILLHIGQELSGKHQSQIGQHIFTTFPVMDDQVLSGSEGEQKQIASLQLNWIKKNNEGYTNKGYIRSDHFSSSTSSAEDHIKDNGKEGEGLKINKIKNKLQNPQFSIPNTLKVHDHNLTNLMVSSEQDSHDGHLIKKGSQKTEVTKKQTYGKSSRKFLFALRYYEQLGEATNNLLALASLAKFNDRLVVMPYVNNSRMNGLAKGISKQRRIAFAPLDSYFDVKYMNRSLKDRGYASLVSYDEFKTECSNKLDFLVHFLYTDKNSREKALTWYKISSGQLRSLEHQTQKHNGWAPCNFIKNANIGKLLGGVKIHSFVCVNPDTITTPEQLEKLVLKDAKCVGLVQWKGNGTDRTHFSLSPSITERLKPSDLKHNPELIDVARHFVDNHIKRPFVATQIRAERHLQWKGMDPLLRCIKRVAKRVKTRKQNFKVNNIFVASDLTKYGSDTFIQNAKLRDRHLVYKYMAETLNQPVTFKPELYNIFDTGQIAIIEMHILSLGESLFTLGGGNFQDWVVDLFLLRNAEDRSLVHRICELR